MNLLQKIMLFTGLLVSIVFGFCWVGGPFPEPGAYREAFAFAGGLPLLLGALTLRQSLRLPFVSLWALGWFILFFLQSKILFYPYPVTSLQAMFYMLWLGLFAWACMQYKLACGRDVFFRWVAMFLVGTGILFVSVCYVSIPFGGVLSYGNGLKMNLIYKGGLTGPLAQANHAAILLTIALACLSHLLIPRWKWRFPVLVAGSIYIAVALAMTGSRTGMLFSLLFTVGVVAYCGLRYAMKLSWKNTFITNLFVAGLIMLACQFLAPNFAQWFGLASKGVSALGRMANSGGIIAVDHSNLLRFEVWLRGWRVFTENPILGVGVGNYAWYDFIERAAHVSLYEQNGYKFAQTHNIFIQVLAEAGLVGLALLLIFVWQAMKVVIKGFFQDEFQFPAVILFCLFVPSMLEYPLWYGYFLVILVLFSVDCVEIALPERTRRLVISTFCVLGGSILLWGYLTIYGFYKIDGVYQLRFSGQGQPALLAAVEQLNSTPFVVPYSEACLISVILPNNNVNDKIFSEAAERVARWNPAVFFLYRVPFWQMSIGEKEKARDNLRKALAFFPKGMESITDEKTGIKSPQIREMIEELDTESKEILRTFPKNKRGQ